jgi:hypothetical protein
VSNPGSRDPLASDSARPVCDEWGLYDPEQAGFEAIVRRLFPSEDDHAPLTQASSLPLSTATSTR